VKRRIGAIAGLDIAIVPKYSKHIHNLIISHQIAIPWTYKLASGRRTRVSQERVRECLVLLFRRESKPLAVILKVVCPVKQR
jgi:hypothetical protein